MDGIKIATINVNGIRNRWKIKGFFRSLKKNNYDIICVQESYIMDEDKELWEREWSGKLFYSCVSKHSMEQIIIIKNNFVYDVKCVYKSDRIITVCVQLPENNLFITNVYAPNNSAEKKDLFMFLANHLQSLDTENQIVLGDFNCVLSNKLDIISGEDHSSMMLTHSPILLYNLTLMICGDVSIL
jgi:exonuclease III